MMDGKKTVSIMVPCYNEEENVVPISEAIVAQMEALPQYDYEILFIDNCSTDNTRPLLRQICAKNRKIKAIFNVKNFGQFNSPFYGLCQTTGDCAISICADFQDPVELIPTFLKYWEEGYQIVHGVKTSSRESSFMYRLRSAYYKLIRKFFIGGTDRALHRLRPVRQALHRSARAWPRFWARASRLSAS